MEIILDIFIGFIILVFLALFIIICCGFVAQSAAEMEAALKGDRKAIVKLVCLGLLGSLFLD